jgi:hypothetical protein
LYHFFEAVVFLLFSYKRQMCMNNIVLQIKEGEMLNFLLMVYETGNIPGLYISIVPCY